jgi:hypothetical protein
LIERGAGVHEFVRQPFARAPGLLGRFVPRAVQLQQFRAPHQALTAERHHVGVRGAPRGQGRGPLLSPPKIEDVVAGAEHAAIHDARDERAHFPGGDRNHHLVETREAGRYLVQVQQHAAFPVAGQRHHVGAADAVANRRRLHKEGPRRAEVALPALLPREQAQQEAPLGAVLAVLLQQPLDACDPATHLGFAVTLVPEQEHAPDGAGGGAHPFARLHVRLEGACARVRARLVETDQMSGGREPVEIIGVERRRAIGISERGIGVGPRLPGIGGASALQRCIHPVQPF